MTRSHPTTGSSADLFGRVTHLLARCGRQDPRSLLHLYDLTAPRVLGLVSRVLGPGEEAGQATVDTFAAVWQGEEVVPDGAGLPWLLHVAHRRAVALRRGRTLVPQQRSGDAAVRAFPPDRAWLPGLEEDERQALSEVYLRGHAVPVADQRLGWEPGTTVAVLHRAMLHLAALHNGGHREGSDDAGHTTGVRASDVGSSARVEQEVLA